MVVTQLATALVNNPWEVAHSKDAMHKKGQNTGSRGELRTHVTFLKQLRHCGRISMLGPTTKGWFLNITSPARTSRAVTKILQKYKMSRYDPVLRYFTNNTKM